MPRELSVEELASAMKEENTSGSEEPAAISVAPGQTQRMPRVSARSVPRMQTRTAALRRATRNVRRQRASAARTVHVV
jgi:hypothetical protein